jgi:FKBP-type peptidyl-prolyl cis-trans isomerase 2
MNLNKNDFIEIEFTGRIKNGGVFDSNLPEELKKLNPNHLPEQSKPFIFSLNQNMFLNGVDNFLIGKDIDKFPADFEIELSPENAFGNRNSKLVQLMPIKVFHQQRLNPVPGVPFNFDGRVGKILSVSGGRVIVDFNNPLAGKDVVYNIKLLRKVEDQGEKINSFMDFLFRKEFPFKIEDKTLIVESDKSIKPIIEMFKDKFKEIFDLDLEVKEINEEAK